MDAGCNKCPPIDARQSEIDKFKIAMKDFLGECTCIPIYKDRDKIDPHCAWCNYGECGAEHLVDKKFGTQDRFEIKYKDGDRHYIYDGTKYKIEPIDYKEK